jgi:hypothetical protein
VVLSALAVTAALERPASARQAATPPPTQAKPEPAPGRGVIVGQVVDSFGVPVSSALVSMDGVVGPQGGHRTLTTAEGRFLFTGLPAGTYYINAQKPGYAPGLIGRQRPDGPAPPLQFADGERHTTARITMWRLASISGTLTDNGEPLVGVTLWTLRRTYTAGRSRFYDGPATTTDDRGMFRFGELEPGEYAVCVIGTQATTPVALVEAFAAARVAGTTSELQRQFSSDSIGFTARLPTAGIRIGDAVLHTVGSYSAGLVPPAPGDDGELRTYRTTCHPGTPGLKQAQTITLSAGEERTGVDLPVTPVRSVSVHGTVVGPDGPAAHVGVRLAPDFAEELGMEMTWESALSVSDAGGRFIFLGVPPGSYTLRAFRMPSAALPSTTVTPTADSTLAANVPLVVGADGLANLTVTLNTGFRISGRFQFDGVAKKPTDVRNLPVVVQHADGHQVGYRRVLRGVTQPDGAFSTWEIPPGRYVISPLRTSYAGWWFKSTSHRGRDLSVEPIDLQSDLSDLVVTFTDDPTEVSGIVRDEGGRPDATAAVVIFPVDRGSWSNGGDAPRRLVHLRPAATGRYSTRNLPPGQYFVAAVDDASTENWQDVRVLELVSRVAQRLIVEDGDKKTVDLVSKVLR